MSRPAGVSRLAEEWIPERVWQCFGKQTTHRLLGVGRLRRQNRKSGSGSWKDEEPSGSFFPQNAQGFVLGYQLSVYDVFHHPSRAGRANIVQ